MQNRSCPLCFVKLPRTAVLALSDDLVCPSCRSELEVSRHSRVAAALFGVIAAYIAAQFAALASPGVAWLLPVVAALLAYGFISALFLLFFADLVIRPTPFTTPFPQTHA
jgi:uncharacterized protein YbaR (Trm112 family)